MTDLLAPIKTRIRCGSAENGPLSEAFPVPTPARPGSGSKGLPRCGDISAPCRGTPWTGRLSAEYFAAVKTHGARRFGNPHSACYHRPMIVGRVLGWLIIL